MSTDHPASISMRNRSQPQRPHDGILRVPPDVLAEVLKEHSQDEINAMPYESRLAQADEAVRRIEARKRAGSANADAMKLREERARRKAEAFAKRQPKSTRSDP